MTAQPFFEPAGSNGCYQLPVTRSATVGPADRKFLMGGVNVAAAVTAAERESGRPLLYASAQFLSFAALGDTLNIDVQLHSQGRSVTQAGVVNRVGEREVLRVNAALGGRDTAEPVQFCKAPGVPSPGDCQPVVENNLQPDDLGAHIEKRHCIEDEAAGYSVTWIRNTDGFPVSTGLVALIADHLAGGLPRTRGSSSLDNQLRVFNLVPTNWFLCETQFHVFAAGFMHGEMRLFADDGTLVATAGQTAALPRSGGEWAQTQARPAQ